jgi:hypothetical protein
VITTKLEGYLIALLLLLVTAGGGALYFYHKGKATELADVKLQSAAVLQKATDQIAALNTSYSTAVKAITETKDAQISQADAAHAADFARISVLNANRKTNPVLGGAPGAPAQPAGGPVGFDALGAELADALRRDDASLIACYADRDALTGK